MHVHRPFHRLHVRQIVWVWTKNVHSTFPAWKVQNFFSKHKRDRSCSLIQWTRSARPDKVIFALACVYSELNESHAFFFLFLLPSPHLHAVLFAEHPLDSLATVGRRTVSICIKAGSCNMVAGGSKKGRGRTLLWEGVIRGYVICMCLREETWPGRLSPASDPCFICRPAEHGQGEDAEYGIVHTQSELEPPIVLLSAAPKSRTRCRW